MPSHVLVPIDASDQSDEALDYALSEHPNSQITALHVTDPAAIHGATTIEAALPATFDAIQQEQEETANRVISNAEEQADKVDGMIDTEQMVGSVAHSVVEFADARDVDHIVLGSHGRTGASRVLLGSVAETVSRRSPVPVTIVR